MRTGLKRPERDHGLATSAAVARGPINTARQVVQLPDEFAPRDQRKEVPCCVSCAIVKAMEAVDGLIGRTSQLSPMFHYYFARTGETGLPWLTLSQGLAAACEHGVSEERLYPSTFRRQQLDTRPSDVAVTAAARFRLHEIDPATEEEGLWELTSSDRVEEWKRALAAGIPVVMGFQVVEEYFLLEHVHPSYDGRDTLHVTGDPSSDIRHAVAVLGYRQQPGRGAAGAFRVADSRGAAFADQGRWWLPFPLVDSALIVEAWAVRSISYGADDA